jgi:hypothetical protein
MIIIHALARDIEQSALLNVASQLARLNQDANVPVVINYRVSNTEIVATTLTRENVTTKETTTVINIPRDLELGDN